MMKSLAVRIADAPKDFGEANDLSQELGNLTVQVRTVSKLLFDLLDQNGRRSRNVSISEQKRPLMLPQEIKELGRDREIIIYEGLRPVLAKKNRYFQDRRLRASVPSTCTRESSYAAHRFCKCRCREQRSRRKPTGMLSRAAEGTGRGGIQRA